MSKEIAQYITLEVPILLKELHERRLPHELKPIQWYHPTQISLVLLPWIDSEVRRYCVSNIIDGVLDYLQVAARW